jgi:sugar O-acyltransferase (sialic acid O-acetyltransferase NeuD family)
LQVIVFGNRSFASLAWHVLTHDSAHTVVGFAVDAAYLTEATLHSLPVVPFEEVEQHFDPARTAMLMSIGWDDANGLRERKYRETQAKGYSFASYVSSRALLSPDLQIGQSCMIFDGAIVQPFACLGDGVILRSGCHVSHHVAIGDFSFVSAHAVIGGGTHLERRCFVGLNATIRDNIRIGERAIIGAGAMIAREVEAGATYASAPARRISSAAQTKDAD